MRLHNPFYLLLTVILLFAGVNSYGQKLSDREIEKYQLQSRDLMGFVEYSLNTVGSANAGINDKSTIINQSYLKVFKDDKVQIEDDLEAGRSTVTNKNVQAYLKDVEFFFQEVKFKFNIDRVDHFLDENGQNVFRVEFIRELQGTTVAGEAVVNNQTRFAEINLDPNSGELKIVSIYTTKVNENKELANWWNGLSYEWKSYFGPRLRLDDGLTFGDLLLAEPNIMIQDSALVNDANSVVVVSENFFTDLKNITQITELNLSRRSDIRDLKALDKLDKLRKLNLSGTAIKDISSLRNLLKLEQLDISETTVRDLTPLKFANSLKELNISRTRITDISAAASFKGLKTLKANNTDITDLSPLREISLLIFHGKGTRVKSLNGLVNSKNLVHLDLEDADFEDLSPIAAMADLEYLNLGNSQVIKLDPISGLSNLKELNIEGTRVSDLMVLGEMPNLEKVVCENTLLTKDNVQEFKATHPNTLVIYESAQLSQWWNDLPQQWRTFLIPDPIDQKNPSAESLHSLVNMKSLDLRNLREFRDLKPLGEMVNLREINLDGTAISDLSILSGLRNLRVLNISNTVVSDLRPLEKSNNLEKLIAKSSQVSNVAPLKDLPLLSYVDLNKTPFCNDKVAQEILDDMDALVLYKTFELFDWWDALSVEWQKVFRDKLSIPPSPDQIQLHQITTIKELDISDNRGLRDLRPLLQLKRLRELNASSNGISNLLPLRNHVKLMILDVSKNPIEDLGALQDLTGLRNLNIDNTPVKSLEALMRLTLMENLSCSGTQVTDLKPISYLKNLRELAVFNTNVKTLKSLAYLRDLKLLNCYNTKLTNKRITEFRSFNPYCEVVFY